MAGFVVVAGPESKAKELKLQTFCLKVFDLPGLKCGGFEAQIMSTDSLAKLDAGVESALRRVERAIVEADKDAKIDKDSDQEIPLTFTGDERTFTVNNRNWCSTVDYLKSFEWNRTKFGNISVQETAQEIQKVVETIESLFRAENQKYLDKKTAWVQVSPPDATGPFSFGTKDLVDVLVPEKVTEKDASKPSAEDDFIYTKNITTVVVIVPAGADAAFLAWHDGCVGEEKVIPGSGRKLERVGTDKDGASLFRVLVMKSGQTAFLKACREAGWALSDFIYKGRAGFEQLTKDRTVFETDFKTSHQRLLTLGLSNWSDLLQCWTHLKVLRAAVEGNLRYGRIPSLALVAMPAEPSAVRKQLSGILGTAKERSMEDADIEDYFPYVSVAMQP